jgi:hypothetical protein
VTSGAQPVTVSMAVEYTTLVVYSDMMEVTVESSVVSGTTGFTSVVDV